MTSSELDSTVLIAAEMAALSKAKESLSAMTTSSSIGSEVVPSAELGEEERSRMESELARVSSQIESATAGSDVWLAEGLTPGRAVEALATLQSELESKLAGGAGAGAGAEEPSLAGDID